MVTYCTYGYKTNAEPSMDRIYKIGLRRMCGDIWLECIEFKYCTQQVSTGKYLAMYSTHRYSTLRSACAVHIKDLRLIPASMVLIKRDAYETRRLVPTVTCLIRPLILGLTYISNTPHISSIQCRPVFMVIPSLVESAKLPWIPTSTCWGGGKVWWVWVLETSGITYIQAIRPFV